MRMDVEIVSFPLARPFVIAGHVFQNTDTVRVTLHEGAHSGRGEAVGTYYLQETAQAMAAQLLALSAEVERGLSQSRIQSLLPPCGARNALDCAFWDLRAKATGQRIWELLDLPPKNLVTVFTIGLAEAPVMADWAREAAAFSHLKIKLDDDSPLQRLEAVRAARPDASLIVDVNQAWTFDELRDYLPQLARLRVALVEQPLPRGGDAQLEGFRSPVPLGADESCLHLGEFEAAARRYDVLNIKLDKCGGLTEGLALVERARSRDMGLMVGNMTGTSLSMAPSFVIGQHCRFVDIDGPLLLAEDIADGLEYAPGGIVSPPAAALWG